MTDRPNHRLTTKRIWKLSPMSDKESEHYIPYTKYNKIMQEIIIEMEEMLFEGKSIYLPGMMGFIRLKKFKPKKLLPNWKATKKLWASDEKMYKERFIIYQDNPHTGGWRVSMSWNKFNCQWKNKGLVQIKRTRGFERRTAWLLKTNSEIIDNIKQQ